MGLGSELVDWYRDATSVPYGHLLIDMSPRPDYWLRYCTNTGSIPSKVSVTERLKHLKSLDDEHTRSLHCQCFPTISSQMQKSFPQVLPNRIIQVCLRMYRKPYERKPARHKETSRDKISKQFLIALLSILNHLDAKKIRSGIHKRVTTHWSKHPCHN